MPNFEIQFKSTADTSGAEQQTAALKDTTAATQELTTQLAAAQEQLTALQSIPDPMGGAGALGDRIKAASDNVEELKTKLAEVQTAEAGVAQGAAEIKDNLDQVTTSAGEAEEAVKKIGDTSQTSFSALGFVQGAIMSHWRRMIHVAAEVGTAIGKAVFQWTDWAKLQKEIEDSTEKLRKTEDAVKDIHTKYDDWLKKQQEVLTGLDSILKKMEDVEAAHEKQAKRDAGVLAAATKNKIEHAKLSVEEGSQSNFAAETDIQSAKAAERTAKHQAEIKELDEKISLAEKEKQAVEKDYRHKFVSPSDFADREQQSQQIRHADEASQQAAGRVAAARAALAKAQDDSQNAFGEMGRSDSRRAIAEAQRELDAAQQAAQPFKDQAGALREAHPELAHDMDEAASGSEFKGDLKKEKGESEADFQKRMNEVRSNAGRVEFEKEESKRKEDQFTLEKNRNEKVNSADHTISDAQADKASKSQQFAIDEDTARIDALRAFDEAGKKDDGKAAKESKRQITDEERHVRADKTELTGKIKTEEAETKSRTHEAETELTKLHKELVDSGNKTGAKAVESLLKDLHSSKTPDELAKVVTAIKQMENTTNAHVREVLNTVEGGIKATQSLASVVATQQHQLKALNEKINSLQAQAQQQAQSTDQSQ